MANIKTSDSKTKSRKFIILPRDQETYNEKFAIANGRQLPFETPVTLRPDDVKAIENQKEPFQTSDQMTVYEAMEKFSVDQTKATEIVQAAAKHPEMTGAQIKWRPKYILQAV